MSKSVFQNYKLGAKRDIPDPRDRPMSAVRRAVTLPEQATVTELQPIMDQGSTNSCTGHAAAYFWAQVLKSRGTDKRLRFNPYFPWYFARAMEGTQNEDEGVYMRSIMKALNEYGCVPIEEWSSTLYNKKPSDEAITWGSALKLPQYLRCTSLVDIQYAIAIENQSVMVGLNVYDHWYNDQSERTGIIPFIPGLEPIGGHALVAVGYTKEDLILANSWGVEYGDKGYLRVSKKYITEDHGDAWTVGFNSMPDPTRDRTNSSGLCGD